MGGDWGASAVGRWAGERVRRRGLEDTGRSAELRGWGKDWTDSVTVRGRRGRVEVGSAG